MFDPETTDNHETCSTSNLVVRVGLREAVETFERSKAEILAALAQIEAAQTRLVAAVPNLRKLHSERGDDIEVAARRAVETLERECWGQLLGKLEFGRFLSVARTEELRAMLDGRRGAPALPALTLPNVMAMLQGMHGQLDELLKESVAEVFEWLRPRGHTRVARLKTNTELEVGPRVVIADAVEKPWGVGSKKHWSHTLNYRQEPYLAALERVFLELDGRGSVTKFHRSEVGLKLLEAAEGETEYFAFKACRNGHLHLKFKRPYLLARFNALAGGKRLRPGKVS